jgi:orotate phosphoribosyltransferase
MVIRRNQRVERGERCVVVEDVITTGGSAREVASAAERMGAEVLGFASIVNRGGNFPSLSLVKMQLNQYTPEECPLCKEGLPLVKPGSREKRNGR